MEKCDRAGQATDDDIMWHMGFAWWITNATHMRARAHTHTDRQTDRQTDTDRQSIYNTYCSSMAAVVT